MPSLFNQSTVSTWRYFGRFWPAAASTLRFLAGILLVFASLQKAASRSEPQIGQLIQGSLLDALILYELSLGLLVISGLFYKFSARVALVTFSSFAAFAFYESLVGARTCNCFGAVPLHPSITAIMDVSLAALFLGAAQE